MGDAHALGQLARLAAKTLLGEELDRLVEDEALALGGSHIAARRLFGGFDGLFDHMHFDLLVTEYRNRKKRPTGHFS